VKYLVIALAAIVGIYYAYPLVLGPDQVIEDVTAFTENNSIVVQVNFSVPVRYENHYPARNGEFLQVKSRLVSLGATRWKESVGQGAVRPELATQIGLVNVAYEGDAPGGPFVTLLFNRPATFEVRQDTSFHNLTIVFPQNKVAPGSSS
jgi:hypothetical protein